MERHLMQYEKECLRKTMLKHEETFKEQICELHRLYQVQKLLTHDMKTKKTRHQATSSYSTYATNCSVQRKLNSNDNSYQAPHHLLRMEKNIIDLDFPAEELAKYHINVVPTHGEMERETDTELTLSTGCRSIKKNKGQEQSHWNVDAHFSSIYSKTDTSHSPDIGNHPSLNTRDRLTGPSWECFRNEQKSYTDEEISRQTVQQPLWLFPVLSLNAT